MLTISRNSIKRHVDLIHFCSTSRVFPNPESSQIQSCKRNTNINQILRVTSHDDQILCNGILDNERILKRVCRSLFSYSISAKRGISWGHSIRFTAVKWAAHVSATVFSLNRLLSCSCETSQWASNPGPICKDTWSNIILTARDKFNMLCQFGCQPSVIFFYVSFWTVSWYIFIFSHPSS